MKVIFGFILAVILVFFSLSQVNAEIIGTNNDGYIIEKFVSGLTTPTAITFVGDDILVIEKNTGKVKQIRGNIISDPVLDLPVSFADESGLLGITSIENHVYLYFTESLSGTDKSSVENSREVVFRYTWDGDMLTNPVLIKEFPFEHGQDSHAGGAMTSHENAVYFVIGDQRQHSKYQNIPEEQNNSKTITSSIFKFNTQDNTIEHFAMGIRNSFGLAIDPITGYLWDTENGDNYYDEINLVRPGFNSGWKVSMGPVDSLNLDTCVYHYELGKSSQCIEWLFDHTKMGQLIPISDDFQYSDPEFSWWETVGVTSIEFPDEDGFGIDSDSMFVGDFNNGRIYKFQLNEDRTDLIFSDPRLMDGIAVDIPTIPEVNVASQLAYEKFEGRNMGLFDETNVLFLEDIPGGITDIEFHNGIMYIVSIFDGSIYKVYHNGQVPPETVIQYDKTEPYLEKSPTTNYVMSDGTVSSSLDLTSNWIIETNAQDIMSCLLFTKDAPANPYCNISPVKNDQTAVFVAESVGGIEYKYGRLPDSALSVIFHEKDLGIKDDKMILDELIERERNSCHAETMESTRSLCMNYKQLSDAVVELSDGTKAYAVLYKTEKKFFHIPSQIEIISEEEILPTLFFKFEIINLVVEIRDGTNSWQIKSHNHEKYFHFYLDQVVDIIKSFTVLNSYGTASDEVETEASQETVQSTNTNEVPEGGGCLIATAAFGSEMAPQVQFLRELRDNTVLQTQSGTSFMTGFNQFYYSFSPTVADYERENPMFKEAVKLTLTPLLTSLTLLNYVDIDTEHEMLGYGIGLILLNIGMYFVAPAIVITKLKNILKLKN